MIVNAGAGVLWPMVEALVHDLHAVAGTSITHLTNTVPEDFVVHADASLVKRVSQNLTTW